MNIFFKMIFLTGLFVLTNSTLAKCTTPPCLFDGVRVELKTPTKKLTRLPYQNLVKKYSKQFKVPINLIYATMWAQSKFDTNLRAPKVAGLFQDGYYIVDKYYPGKELTDPDFSIMLGTKTLKKAMAKHSNPTNIYISAYMGEYMLKDKEYLKHPSMVNSINEFNDAYSKLLKGAKQNDKK